MIDQLIKVICDRYRMSPVTAATKMDRKSMWENRYADTDGRVSHAVLIDNVWSGKLVNVTQYRWCGSGKGVVSWEL